MPNTVWGIMMIVVGYAISLLRRHILERSLLSKLKVVCLVVALLFSSWTALHTAVAQGKTWYVSTTGSDITGNGSAAAPFATIQHGVEEARNNDTVLVYPGTYYENVHV